MPKNLGAAFWLSHPEAQSLPLMSKITEASVRDDLAAAHRICHKLGLNEGVCNHLSALLPGYEDRFLVCPYGLLWSEVTPESLVVITSEGKVIQGEGEVDISAFEIHLAMHAVNPERNNTVLHTHMPYTTALCCIEREKLPNSERLQMISQNALRFYKEVAYDDEFNGFVLDNQEGDRLASWLKEKRVGLQKHHGVFVCGKTVSEAFDDMYYLEQAAKVQVLAMSTNIPLALVDEETCKATKKSFDEAKAKFSRPHLDAWKRQLLRDDPKLHWLDSSVNQLNDGKTGGA